MSDLHAAIMNLPCEPDTSIHAERQAFKRGHKQARHAAAELVGAQEVEAELDGAAAVAAIQFALRDDEGMQFLRCWNEGDFDSIRREWPEAPEAVFIGADPQHNPDKKIMVDEAHRVPQFSAETIQTVSETSTKN